MITAMAVQMMNRGTRLSIKVSPASVLIGAAPARKALQILGGAVFRSGFVVSLAARVVSRAELVFLLVQHIAAAIHPVVGLRTSVIGASAHVFPALFRLGKQCFA